MQKRTKMMLQEPSRDEARTRTLDIDDADAELIDVPKKALFDVITAANYLDFTDLLDLGNANLSL